MSLRDESELTFMATSLQESRESLIASRYSKYGVLPVAVLYGANGSGKSNFLAALTTLRSMVLRSFKEADGEPRLPYKPFALDDISRTRPTSYVLDLVLEDTRYQYGVIHDLDRVHEEWLYAYPKMAKQILFSRNFKEREEFYFGRALVGNNRQVASITQSHVLFLSAAAAAGHPVLGKLADFFRESLAVRTGANASPAEMVARALEASPDMVTEVTTHLGHVDTGISEIKIDLEDMPTEVVESLRDFNAAIAKLTKVDDLANASKRRRVRLGHTSVDGIVRYIDYSDESLGTQHLLTVLPLILTALRRGSVLLLDELTTSLHTLIAKKLVQIFQDERLNAHGAQLIFSTHDTNLLAPGLLRRDAVWFIEKSGGGVTTVFPLTDIQTKNTDNIERGYIQGRFGAIPIVRGD